MKLKICTKDKSFFGNIKELQSTDRNLTFPTAVKKEELHLKLQEPSDLTTVIA
jgi:hypothetical protein